MDTRSPRFVKAMTQARNFGLTRDDRIDLAEYLLRRDIQSWTELTEDQLSRVLDALDGCSYILHLVESGRHRQDGGRT